MQIQKAATAAFFMSDMKTFRLPPFKVSPIKQYPATHKIDESSIMSSAWAGGADAIIERMEQMTTLFIEEARKSIYTGESAINCKECGQRRRKAISCKY